MTNLLKNKLVNKSENEEWTISNTCSKISLLLIKFSIFSLFKNKSLHTLFYTNKLVFFTHGRLEIIALSVVHT